MAVGYFNREGLKIGKVEWAELREDKDYRTVRLYDNGQVRLRVEWIGMTDQIGQVFRDYYQLFVLHVENYDATGVLRRDPVEHGKTYPNEKLAVLAYEEFLTRWSNCHRDDAGEFIEEDNSFALPPPPNPDAPTSDAGELECVKLGEDDVGVW